MLGGFIRSGSAIFLLLGLSMPIECPGCVTDWCGADEGALLGYSATNGFPTRANAQRCQLARGADGRMSGITVLTTYSDVVST